MKNILKLGVIGLAFILPFAGCQDDPVYIGTGGGEDADSVYMDTGYFAKGADVSWITEMESNDIAFYNADGEEMEAMELMRSLGMNTIRLRVWVNPSDGWCNKTDVLVKAKRAADLGMRIMIDFHYSDTWADPGDQDKPAAWTNISTLDSLCLMVSEHTTEVLTALADWDITPEWVQVGNETTHGMLWDDDESVSGYLTANDGANYTKLHNAGYDAAKAIFPDTKVVLMIDRGYNNDYTSNMLTTIIGNDNDCEDAKLDVFGVSLYPATTNYTELNTMCKANLQWVVDNYDYEVMVCEVGMSYDEATTCKIFIADLISKIKSISNTSGEDRGVGVMYWEPQAYNGWKSYSLGAFNDDGTPTEALDAFGE